ncbi:MAG TPA: L-serine ammonia-lyase, iron-sulfur-dependent, subunit alpha [Sedimentisphaerales bacterium]|nr:L-serine ammonia-lyase, iron-sulfur-dependent, subunit alpha [Sedimentisphaerales bacterium]
MMGSMYTIKDILRIQVTPALGCTEPAAVALCTAAGTAVQAALFSLHGLSVGERDGIVALTPEQTTRNMGQISTKGMIETDRTILQIMVDKQFS